MNLPLKPKILIIRFSSLGDVTLATGIAPSLKRNFPGASVTFLTKKPYNELLALAPGLDDVVALESGESIRSLTNRLYSRRFDLIIDLHGNLRSRILCHFLKNIPQVRAPGEIWKRRALVWFKYRTKNGIRTVTERYATALNSIGPSLKPEYPRLTLNGTGRTFQEKMGLGQLPKPVIGFCVSSQHATKRWCDDAARRCIAGLLSSTKGSIVLVGTNDSSQPCVFPPSNQPILDLRGKTSLKDLTAALAACSVLVTVDSAPLHIAEALGVPVASLFGPTVADFGFAPWGPRSRLLEMPMSCRPCSLHGSAACPLGHHQCMKDITPERVIEEALSILKTKDPS